MVLEERKESICTMNLKGVFLFIGVLAKSFNECNKTKKWSKLNKIF